MVLEGMSKAAKTVKLGLKLFDYMASTFPNFVTIGQTVAEISRFLWFSKMAAAAILDFRKFEILAVGSL